MQDLKYIIASNIVAYRTACGLTQLELSQKLNYSDKAVSKWERAQSLPDIYVLKQIADTLGITVNDLLTERADQEAIVSVPSAKYKISKRAIISVLSVLLVWLVATIVFVGLTIFAVPHTWLCFIYALPASFIVATVFSALWGNRLSTGIVVSLLVWTLILSIYLTFLSAKSGLLFLIGIPLQAMVALWFVLMSKRDRAKANLNK